MVMELLIGSRDLGTMLGREEPGARGLLDSYLIDNEERMRLYEAVAYECDVSCARSKTRTLTVMSIRQSYTLLNILYASESHIPYPMHAC